MATQDELESQIDSFLASRETRREDHRDAAPIGYSHIRYDRKRDPMEQPVVARQQIFQGGYLGVEKLTVELPDGRRAPTRRPAPRRP